MGTNPATFNSGGEQSQHYMPGAYSRLKYAKGTGGLVSSSNGVIMGDCRGGKPNIMNWFGSPAEAEETLRNGPLLDAIKHAFAPGAGYVPQRVGAIRVNPGTQSIRDLEKSSTVMINLKSWDYGLHTNQLKLKLEAGATGKKITLSFQNNEDYVVDDILRESLSIQYTGAGAAVTMDITKTHLTTTVDAGGDLNLDFASFPNVEDIVNYINDQTDYTCSLIGLATAKSTELDTIAAQDIKTSEYTATSDLQALIDELHNSPWIDSALYNTGASTRELPDNDASMIYFTGAVDGSYTTTEWTASLLFAEGEDIQLISASVEDAAIHAQIKVHCAAMNSVIGKAERQFILGGAAGETIAQIKVRALNLATEFGMIAYPGFVHYDHDDLSKTKTWSPAYYAAKLLGMMVALSLNEPATYKTVNVLSWAQSITITQAEELIKAGVCCGIKHKSGRLLTARTITTYQGSELQKNEFSMMREALFVSRDLREAIERSFVGKAMVNSLLGGVDAIAYGKLSTFSDLGLFNGSPAYWGYKKTVLGDQIKVEYDCNLTPPTNFVFITSHMHVYASTQS